MTINFFCPYTKAITQSFKRKELQAHRASSIQSIKRKELQAHRASSIQSIKRTSSAHSFNQTHITRGDNTLPHRGK
jgi:hypothetical protein